MLSKLTSMQLALLALLLVVVVIIAAAVLVALGHEVPTWFVTIALTGLATSLGHATVTSLASSTPGAPTAAATTPQVDPPAPTADQPISSAPAAIQTAEPAAPSILEGLSSS